MILTLYSVKKNDEEFISYLIDELNTYAEHHIDLDRCKNWDEYLKYRTGRNFDSKDIILTGFKNLLAIKHITYVQLEVNPNIMYNIDKLNLLCLAISYGTLEMPGYDLFDEAFNYVLINIDSIYEEYLLEKEGA